MRGSYMSQVCLLTFPVQGLEYSTKSWWRHQMESFFALLALCAGGEFTGPGEFPAQRPVTRSFDVFFDLRLNKWLSKQPWGWLFETPPWSLWRQCNVLVNSMPVHLAALGIARPSTGMILTVLGNRIAYSYLSLSKVQQPVPFLDWQAFPLWR